MPAQHFVGRDGRERLRRRGPGRRVLHPLLHHFARPLRGLAILAHEVAQVFTDCESVNQALRDLAAMFQRKHLDRHIRQTAT